MKLEELIRVVESKFAVGVNKGEEFVEEFDDDYPMKVAQYRNATVVSVHVFNEDTIAINVDIS